MRFVGVQVMPALPFARFPHCPLLSSSKRGRILLADPFQPSGIQQEVSNFTINAN